MDLFLSCIILFILFPSLSSPQLTSEKKNEGSSSSLTEKPVTGLNLNNNSLLHGPSSPSSMSINTTKPLTALTNGLNGGDGFSPWSNKDVLIRALIVVACVSVIAIVYMLVRCLRQKHQMSKGRKYGLIATSQDDKLEMEPLDSENEEDEDQTIFDRSSASPLSTNGTIQATRTANQINRLKNGIKMMKDKAP